MLLFRRLTPAALGFLPSMIRGDLRIGVISIYAKVFLFLGVTGSASVFVCTEGPSFLSSFKASVVYALCRKLMKPWFIYIVSFVTSDSRIQSNDNTSRTAGDLQSVKPA